MSLSDVKPNAKAGSSLRDESGTSRPAARLGSGDREDMTSKSQQHATAESSDPETEQDPSASAVGRAKQMRADQAEATDDRNQQPADKVLPSSGLESSFGSRNGDESGEEGEEFAARSVDLDLSRGDLEEPSVDEPLPQAGNKKNAGTGADRKRNHESTIMVAQGHESEDAADSGVAPALDPDSSLSGDGGHHDEPPTEPSEMGELSASEELLPKFPTVSRNNQGSENKAGKSSNPKTPTVAANRNYPPSVEGYEILERIGKGSMGTVWRAREEGTERQVAIKFLDPRRLGSDLARARFEREVKLTARLEHPNIARIYATGLSHGTYYYVMELVDGVTLEKHVRQHELDEKGTARLLAKVCHAVDYAHKLGVIHRDLKPSNIIINRECEPRIVDFGLAKPVVVSETTDAEETLSTEGQITGTPGYMSPEQAAGRVNEIDLRSDVYCLGAILFKLLTNEYPHPQKGALYEVTRRIAEEECRRPRELKPDLNRDLEALLLKALSHAPEDRYESARALADDIDRFLHREPLRARKLTLWGLFMRRLRRHWLAATIVFVLITVYLFTIVTAVMVIRDKEIDMSADLNEERSRTKALQQRLEALHEAIRRRDALNPGLRVQLEDWSELEEPIISDPVE